MQVKETTILLFVTLLLRGPPSHAGDAGAGALPSSPEEAEECLVYQALLHSNLDFGKRILVLIRTDIGWAKHFWGFDAWSKNPQVDASERVAFDNFKARNRTPVSIARCFFKSDGRIEPTTKRAHALLGFLEQSLRNRERNVSVEFSSVGFDMDRTRAIVYVGRTWGGTYGKGIVVLLAKRGGTWRIEREQMCWIS